MYAAFHYRNVGGQVYLEDLEENGRITLRWILSK
jgi:hypothetical protein